MAEYLDASCKLQHTATGTLSIRLPDAQSVSLFPFKRSPYYFCL
jgi:hypothetical protein